MWTDPASDLMFALLLFFVRAMLYARGEEKTKAPKIIT